MRQVITIMLMAVLIFSIYSCNKTDEDIFDKSAAERLNEAIFSIDSTLTASKHGWVMNYFPTSKSAGYTLLVKFNSNREAIVASQNQHVANKYIEEKSLFDVIGDYGPVLTFNTYNKVLHLFSDPIDPDGKGFEGDYEFVVKSCSDTLIELIGKKGSAYIGLNPFPSNNDWKSYLERINEIDKQVFGGANLVFITGRDSIILSNGSSHVFNVLNNKLNSVSQIPFIVTVNGIRFYEAFSITENRKVQNFILSPDGKTLIAENDPKAIIAGAMGIGTYFASSKSTFVLDTSKMSPHYLVQFRNLYQQMSEKYGGKRNVDFTSFSYKEGFGNSFSISTTPTVIRANYKLNYKLDKASQNVEIEIEEGIFDSNGEILYSNIESVGQLLNILRGEYILTSSLSQTEIKFTYKSDPERFFVVSIR